MTSRRNDPWGVSRRGFLQSFGVGATLASWSGPSVLNSTAFAGEFGLGTAKRKAVLKVAFLYPPTSQLEEEGYFSWPGSTFQAEKRHQEYLQRFKDLENKFGLTLDCGATPISTSDQIEGLEDLGHETIAGFLLDSRHSLLHRETGTDNVVECRSSVSGNGLAHGFSPPSLAT